MSSPFLDHLAGRLGTSTPDAEQALERVAEIVQERIAHSGEVKIEGLGTFRRNDGRLTFEAEASLQQVINFRYEGMPVVPGTAPPVESQPPQHATPDPPPPDFTSTTSDTEAPAPETPPETALDDEAVPPIADSPTEDVASDAEADRDDLADLLSGVWTPQMAEGESPLGPSPDRFEDADFQVMDAGAEPTPVERDRPRPGSLPPEPVANDAESPGSPAQRGSPTRPEPQSSAAPASAEVTSGQLPPDRPGGGAGRPSEEDAVDDEPSQPKRRRTLWPLLAISLVMIAATGGLVYWILVAHPESPTTPEPAAEIESPLPPAVDEPVADDPVEAEPEPVPDGPLRSAAGVDPDQGGFTWVISEPSRSTAEGRAARYREQGYRVSVLPATVRGSTVYRVAIGQFATRSEANQHRDELPADVPGDIWVLEF